MTKYTKHWQAVVLATSEGASAAIRHNGIQLAIKVPSSVSLTFYGSAELTGTFKKIRRRTSADTGWTAFEDVTMSPDVEGIYPVPDEVLCVPFLKIVAGSAISVELYTLGDGETRETRT